MKKTTKTFRPTFRLKCLKCGRITATSRRVRRCRQIETPSSSNPNSPYNVGHYICYGKLARQVHKKTRESSMADKLAASERGLKKSLSRLRRAGTSVKMWQRRVARYTKLLADIPVDARRDDMPVDPIDTSRGARAIAFDE